MTKDAEPSRVRPINPLSGHGEGLEHGGDDEEKEETQEDEIQEDEEDENEHPICGQCENNPSELQETLEHPPRPR